ncbi:hypothetical protein M885DRAFT_506774 [Pelagophyceae sp. CCMP2097]|nr:hypothetical protein M885DRAFT_506774 [Pelagophyceae sp. CCMP2097]
MIKMMSAPPSRRRARTRRRRCCLSFSAARRGSRSKSARGRCGATQLRCSRRSPRTPGETTPIRVEPSACPAFVPEMIPVLAAFYAGGALELPPDVELEELLVALDYFGISAEPASVGLSAATLPAQLRARALTNDLDLYDISKDSVFTKFATDAKLECNLLAFKLFGVQTPSRLVHDLPQRKLGQGQAVRLPRRLSAVATSRVLDAAPGAP